MYSAPRVIVGTVNGIVDQLETHLGIGRGLSVLIVIVGLFVVAWLVSRIATNIATYSVNRSERRRAAKEEVTDTAVITGIRQRETAIALIQTSIRYLAFALAFVFSLATMRARSGSRRSSARPSSRSSSRSRRSAS